MGLYSYPRGQVEYGEQEFAMWHSTRTQGVFFGGDNLAVIPASGMSVKITTMANGAGMGRSGRAWLNIYPNGGGIVQWIDEDVTVTLPRASGTQDRIDRIIFAHNYIANAPSGTPQIYFKQGAYSDNPVPPEIVRRYGEAWELSLAQIYIPKGSAEITPDMIIDERLDESVCGLMATPEVSVPTQAAYDAIYSLLTKLGEDERITVITEDPGARKLISGLTPYSAFVRSVSLNPVKTGI